MRVVCIDDSDQEGDDVPSVVKGNIYTVINSEKEPREEDEEYYYPRGVYYELLEMGPDNLYHSSCFIPINEDQQDETEMEREYNKVTKV